jgi:hypothetical protein
LLPFAVSTRSAGLTIPETLLATADEMIHERFACWAASSFPPACPEGVLCHE